MKISLEMRLTGFIQHMLIICKAGLYLRELKNNLLAMYTLENSVILVLVISCYLLSAKLLLESMFIYYRLGAWKWTAVKLKLQKNSLKVHMKPSSAE